MLELILCIVIVIIIMGLLLAEHNLHGLKEQRIKLKDQVSKKRISVVDNGKELSECATSLIESYNRLYVEGRHLWEIIDELDILRKLDIELDKILQLGGKNEKD